MSEGLAAIGGDETERRRIFDWEGGMGERRRRPGLGSGVRSGNTGNWRGRGEGEKKRARKFQIGRAHV